MGKRSDVRSTLLWSKRVDIASIPRELGVIAWSGCTCDYHHMVVQSGRCLGSEALVGDVHETSSHGTYEQPSCVRWMIDSYIYYLIPSHADSTLSPLIL